MSSKLTTAAIASACQELMAGAPIKAVAIDLGVSAAHLCKTVHAAGLAHIWTTAEERAALAALRSGTSALVLKAAAAPAVLLRDRIEAALAEYGHQPSRVPQRVSARNAANRGAAPAKSLFE